MSRVITFSRQFPSYHPRAGEPTYFVEKIWNGLPIQISYKLICDLNPKVPTDILWAFWQSIDYSYENDSMTHKYHTIRAGNRWKVGDWFSPRVWSGVPYNSKQITIAPDLQIKKVWDFEVNRGTAISDDDIMFFVQNYIPSVALYDEVAKNDGLAIDDLYGWFTKPMLGQINCWSDSITY